MTETRPMQFFQIVLSEFNLLIPPEFVQRLEGEDPLTRSETAYLKGHKDRTYWKVDVLKGENVWVFQRLWSEFVGDHSVEVGDMLVFKYEGDLGFEVSIFGHRSSCEKQPSSSSAGGNVVVQYTPPPQLDLPPITETEGGEEVTETEEGEEEEGEGEEDEEEAEGGGENAVAIGATAVLQRALEALENLSPNSFSLICERLSDYNWLAMPIHDEFVIRNASIPHNSERATLRSANGEWAVMFDPMADGRAFTSAEWTLFVNDNGIMENDVCVFEVVNDAMRQGEEEDTIFNVTIYSVVPNSP